MFVIEFIKFFDGDRNTSIRSKLNKLIKSTNFKKANSMQKMRDGLVLLEQYPDDLVRVQEQINVFYNTHFDKNLLLDEIKSTVYRFDRTTLSKIMEKADGYWSSDLNTQQKQRSQIKEQLRAIGRNFVKFGEPSFEPEDVQSNILISCQDVPSTDSTYAHCSGKKLLMPAKRFDEFLELFADDLLNPLKNPYIIALIFMENVIDEFKFERRPGEEIYIKF